MSGRTGFNRVHGVAVTGLLLFFTFAGRILAETVTVSSLEELMPYLSQDHVDVVMTPGVYTITAEDAKAGQFGSTTFQDWCKTLLPFSGSDSRYDFTDVTLKVETGVFQSLGKFDILEVQTTGDNIVIKNLTIEDVGSVYDAPTKGALGIVLDGSHNRLDGVHLSTKGSYPYGYGEAFGKGGRNVVRHMKHCGILVRGYANHVKDCTIIHRCFGHALFMQAADQPVIEGCYIEGDVRYTDDMLAEKGTGTIADNVNFMTYFGYPIPPGYAMCTGEEGIRAYDGGQTWIDGKIINRRAMNPTILNCTIKNMRGGVTLTHAGGKKYVEGCTAIGCTRGFAIGSGDIVDCYADTQYGPALGVDYESDSGMNAEITLLPNAGPMVNGTQYAAYIIGKNHHITFKSRCPNPDQSLIIKVGGDKLNIGSLAHVETFSASNITLNNLTAHPIVLGDTVENCEVATGGLVVDLGRQNRVTHVPVTQLEVVDKLQTELGVGEDVEYALPVPLPGTYWIDYHATAPAGGMFTVSVDGDAPAEVAFRPDRSQAWTTVRSATPVYLSGKEHALRLASGIAGLKLKGLSLVLDYPATLVEPCAEVFNTLGESLGDNQKTDLKVFPGQTICLKPGPSFGGEWHWTGPNGFSSSAREVELPALTPKQSGSYVATFVNVEGYETSATYEIEVSDRMSIEAENYSTMNGVSTEATKDAGGGDTVTDLAMNDWVEYEVNVPYPAQYVIGYRVAGGGGLTTRVKDTEIDQVSFEDNGWQTVSSKQLVYLHPGPQTLRLTAQSDGLKLNWIKLVARTRVSDCHLPWVYRLDPALEHFAMEALDISNLPELDVHVVFRNGSSAKAYVQIDNGRRMALTPGRTMASISRLSGNVLTLTVEDRRGQSAFDAVEGIYVLEHTDPFARIEAEDYDDAHGTQQEETSDAGGGRNVGTIKDGNWLKYANLNLEGARRINVRQASIYAGGRMEIRLDSETGKKIGEITIEKTGNWQTWKTLSAPIAPVGGIHDVYLVFRDPESHLGNINWFEFSPKR